MKMHHDASWYRMVCHGTVRHWDNCDSLIDDDDGDDDGPDDGPAAQHGEEKALTINKRQSIIVNAGFSVLSWDESAYVREIYLFQHASEFFELWYATNQKMKRGLVEQLKRSLKLDGFRVANDSSGL